MKKWLVLFVLMLSTAAQAHHTPRHQNTCPECRGIDCGTLYDSARKKLEQIKQLLKHAEQSPDKKKILLPLIERHMRMLDRMIYMYSETCREA